MPARMPPPRKNYDVKNGVIEQFLIKNDHQWDFSTLIKIDRVNLTIDLIEAKHVVEGALEEDELAGDFPPTSQTSTSKFQSMDELKAFYENAIAGLLRKGYQDRNAADDFERVRIDLDGFKD